MAFYSLQSNLWCASLYFSDYHLCFFFFLSKATAPKACAKGDHSVIVTGALTFQHTMQENSTFFKVIPTRFYFKLLKVVKKKFKSGKCDFCKKAIANFCVTDYFILTWLMSTFYISAMKEAQCGGWIHEIHFLTGTNEICMF